MSAYTHSGHVYFAACGKYVKIGYTSQQVAKRIASLPGRVRVPIDFDPADTIWLMRAFPGCVIRDERRMHSLFSRHHAEGEWFNLTPAFIDQLERMQYMTYLEERLALRRERAALRRAGFNAYANPSEKPSRHNFGIPTEQAAS